MRKVLTAIIIGWIMLFSLQLNSFDFIEGSLTDKLTMKTRPVDPRIKIVAIDSESLDKIGKWPMPRDLMAGIIDKIAANEPAAVWVNVLYTEKSPDPAEDKALADVIAKYDNVFLPVSFEFESLQKTKQEQKLEYLKLPVVDIPQERIGHINVVPDNDQVVRKILLGIPSFEAEIIPIIGVRLANLLLPEDSKITWNENYAWYRGQEKIPINQRLQTSFSYASSPDESKFEIIPIWKVIENEFDPAYFKDSIVMIGPYAAGLQDQFMTPMSNDQMYGVEVHANILQAFLDNKIYSKASNLVSFIIVVIGGILFFALANSVSARVGVLLLAFLIIGYSAIVSYYFNSQAVLLPYFYTIFALILAYVTAVIGHYLKERKERNEAKDIFGRYVSKAVVAEIISSKEEIKVGGVRKDVTLIFVDIRGFTPLTEKMEPEEVITILNKYLDLFTKAVFKHEGTLDKFMGDAVMSIFGAPIAQEDHAERAVRAALEMRRKSREVAEDLQNLLGLTVNFGIGINSGLAVIGNVGSDDRLDYTAIGETVNLAARLEAKAKPGQILISSATYLRIKDTFECTKLEPIQVKGMEELVDVYQVEWEIDGEDDDEDYDEEN